MAEKPPGVCGNKDTPSLPTCGVRDGTHYNGIGKTLFLQQCACCHNPNMKMRSTGPALAGVSRRWAGEYSCQRGIVLSPTHPHSIRRDKTKDYGGN